MDLFLATDQVIFAFSLTLFAGLATGIGSVIGLLSRQTNTRFLAVSLGFSAGVMIYVSLIEIFPKARELIEASASESTAYLYTTLAFFLGIGAAMLIDALVPGFENPHEIRGVEEMEKSPRKLMRMGVFSAIAIAIHNFPEGLATFTSALTDPVTGISIAFAIAIHNIPEGVAVSVPIFFATASRKKAFKWSFLSGLSEPVGAAIGFLILMPILNEMIMGWVFAMVAGIMVFISLDELLPTAEKYGEHHLAIYGLIAGMLVMALSLVAFAASVSK